MSFVVTQPESLAAAVRVLHAAAPTSGVVPAAADEVSALTATQFAMPAQPYQGVSADAVAIGAGSYAATEAADAIAAV
jgi:hypothetical protein